MILVIGGYAQGKLEYVKEKYLTGEEDIFDFDVDDIAELKRYSDGSFSDSLIVLNNINSLIKKELDDGKDPEELLEKILSKFNNAIIITDEVGNGIVPIDKNERIYREKTGRLQCMLAQNADEVIRVTCGLGQRIK